MALIKCKGCGQMVSTKAEKCPKCGYSVRLSMKQQEEANQPVTLPLDKKSDRSSKKGLIAVIVAVVIIVCGGIGWVVYNGNLGNNIGKQDTCIIFANSNDEITDNDEAIANSQGAMTIEITPELTEAVQKYDNLGQFYEELAKVRKGGLYGFINKKGEEVIPCRYDNVGGFSEGLAIVVKNSLCGFINKKGEEVIPCRYDDAWFFSEGLAKVKKDCLWGFVNKNGEEVVPCRYDRIESFSEEGLAKVEKDRLYGFINKKGEEVIPCRYDDAWFFSEGLAMVRKDGLWGFVNKNGEEAVPCRYDDAWFFSEGLAKVEKDRLYGFIDKQGNEVIPCKYTYARSFSEGLAAVQMADADGIPNVGYIDSKGNETIPCIYNSAGGMYPFSKGIAIVMNEQGFLGGIDIKGKEILPFVYGDIQVFENVIVTREAVSQSYGLLDKTGNEISTSVYDAIYPSDDGLIIVVKDGKSGFINQDGKEVIPLMFDAYFEENSDEGWVVGCHPFVEGVSIVKLNGKYGAIDEQGNEIVPYIYDEIGSFSEGLAPVKIGDKWGYVDKKGNSTFSQDEITIAKQNVRTINVGTKHINTQDEETEEVSGQPKEIIITMNAHSDAHGAMSNLSGSYGVYQRQYYILRTNPISVPEGKIWIFKQFVNNSTVRIFKSKSFITALDDGYIPEISERHLLSNMNESFTFIGGASIQGYIEIDPYPNGGDIAVEFHFIEKI